MTGRLDSVIGARRVSELVASYCARLRDLDRLPDSVAARVALAAYADPCAYLIVAPGQVWEAAGPFASGVRLFVLELCGKADHGHCSICLTPEGTEEHIQLDRLASNNDLVYWPQS